MNMDMSCWIVRAYMYEYTLDGNYGYKLTCKLWWPYNHNLVLERLVGCVNGSGDRRVAEPTLRSRLLQALYRGKPPPTYTYPEKITNFIPRSVWVFPRMVGWWTMLMDLIVLIARLVKSPWSCVCMNRECWYRMCYDYHNGVNSSVYFLFVYMIM